MVKKGKRAYSADFRRPGSGRNQFLEHEQGALSLNPDARVRMALVFPNVYGVGMASVGFQTVYYAFNQHPEVRCERVFAQGFDRDKEICTFESNTPIRQCDVIAFTLAFELDIPNVLNVLVQSKLSPLRKERSQNDPIILMGGVVAGLNPSPLLPFMDGLLVGEGEGLFYELGELFYQAKMNRDSRDHVLEKISRLPGFLVPGLNADVTRRVLPSLDQTEAFTPIITPKSHFKDMFVVEVGRGCKRGCYFCAAQHLYEPFRTRSRESILNTIATHNPGAKRIGLESAGLSDYPDLIPLLDDLIQLNYQVSFSSIRADKVTPELLERVVAHHVKSFTIAPEAGNEALRRRIGKGITQNKLMQAVDAVSKYAVDVLKLYFLIGLPSETEEDVASIGELIREMALCFQQSGKRKQIRVSVNAFIPKPFTEFQWAPMDTKDSLKAKRKQIESSIKSLPNVELTSKSDRLELMQGVLAMGDETVGLALLDHIVSGRSWNQCLNEHHVDINHLCWEGKSFETPLPWSMIKDENDPVVLWKRYQSCLGK